jgi:hypothetical protein
MPTLLEDLPNKVRAQGKKMHALLKAVESKPLAEVVPAIEQMKKEIDTLISLANEISGRRD